VNWTHPAPPNGTEGPEYDPEPPLPALRGIRRQDEQRDPDHARDGRAETERHVLTWIEGRRPASR
jgi:hypothetical protein